MLIWITLWFFDEVWNLNWEFCLKNWHPVLPLRTPTLYGLILSCKKFYKIICEILVSKTVCGSFLILVNFVLKSKFGNHKITESWNISRKIYFEKFPQTVLKILSAKIRWKLLFLRDFFQKLGAVFGNEKSLLCAPFFCAKN